MTLDGRRPGNRTAAFGILVFGGFLAGLFAVSDTPLVALAFVPLVPVAARVAVIRAWVDGDRLHVRNFWRTYDLGRGEISHFEVIDDIDFRTSRRRMVYVCLPDRRRRAVSATKRVYRKLLAFLPKTGKRNDADEICERLNDWLRSGA